MPALSTVFWIVILLFIDDGQCSIRSQLAKEIQEIGQQISSLTFVFDTTSSMLDDLKEVRFASRAILKEIMERESLLIDNLVLVPFHDPEIGPPTVTNNLNSFVAALDELYVQGGGDCAEAALGGIKLALEVSWPRSYIFVFTDAPPKDVHLEDEVMDLVQLTNSRVVFVLTHGCDDANPKFGIYRRIATIGKGEVFNLEDERDITPIVNFINVSISDRQVILFYKAEVKFSTTFTFFVDSCVQILLVTASSHYTSTTSPYINSLEVYDPSGVRFDDKVVNLNIAKVIKIDSPKAGQWSVDVFASGYYGIQVRGRSYCDFEPKFAYSSAPKSFYARPATGKETFLAMDATRPPTSAQKYICNCTEAIVSKMTLYNIKDYKLHQFTMNWIAGDQFSLNTVAPFKATTEPFFIETKGTDENGFPFQRISRTVIPGIAGPPAYIPLEDTVFWQDEGKLLALPCPHRSVATATVTWKKLQKRTDIVLQGSAYVTTADGRLIIRSTVVDDAGNYQCHIRSSEGTTDGQKLKVHIATVPVILKGPQRIATSPGTNVQFSCHAQGIPVPTVTWFFNKSLVTSKQQTLNEMDRVEGGKTISNFDVSDVKFSDEGLVTCIATNRAGVHNMTAMLLVQTVPRVALKKKSILIHANETAQFTCTAEGVPLPTVFWYRNGIVMTDKVSGSQAKQQLSFLPAQLSDRGDYTCKAINAAGMDEKKATLNVYLAPSILERPADQTVLVSQTTKLRCVVDGSPKPRTLWRHNGNLLNGKDTVRSPNIQFLDDYQMLVIRNTQLLHGGVYECIGRSPLRNVARVRARCFLTVYDPPTVKAESSSVIVVLNQQTSLTFSVSGHPVPSVSWLFGGHSLSEDIHDTIHRNETRTLTIHNAQKSDAGDYTLFAVNPGGKSSATIGLTVYYAPNFVSRPVNLSVIVRERAVLECIGNGIPSPVISWSKMVDGVLMRLPMFENKTQLIFNSTKLSDAGKYVCNLQNVIGQETASAQLIVTAISPTILSKVKTVSVVMNESVTLPCDVSGVPTPNRSWLRHGHMLAEISGKYANVDRNLLIEKVDLDDSGDYQCIATNIGGTDSWIITLNILYAPVISTPQHNVRILASHCLTLNCSAVGNPAPAISWKQDNVLLSDGIRVIDGRTQLIMCPIDMSHTATYTCTAVNSVGSAEVSGSVFVIVPPTIQSDANTQVAPIASNVWLPCSVTGIPSPTVNWLKDSRPIVSSSRLFVLANGSLLIHNVKKTDIGSYKCVAVNEGGRDERDVHLDIEYPPHLFSVPSNETLLTGSLLLWHCNATGNPAPSISWLKDGRKLETDSNYVISDGGTKLAMARVDSSYSGKYTCKAINSLGEDNATVFVFVLVPPVIVTTVRKSAGLLHSDAQLPCQAIGIPQPTIQWTRNGISLDDAPYKYKTLSNGTLHIFSLLKSDNVTYVCKAENVAGSQSLNITLDVHVPATIVTDLADHEVLVEKSTSLLCSVSGNPEPAVAWYKDEILVRSNDDADGIELKDNSRLLVLNRAKPIHAGQYTCEAVNVVTDLFKEKTVTVRTSCHMTVLVPPRVALNTSKAVLKKGDAVSFYCQATGIPSPHIQWIKRGSNSLPSRSVMTSTANDDTNGSILHITTTLPADSGEYVCEAANKVGNDNTSTELDVQYAPVIVISPSNKTVISKESVTWHCVADANPVAVIRWIKDGNRLKTSSNMQISDDANTIEFQSVVREDAGEYICRAKNEIGRSSVSATLEVYVGAKIESTVNAVEGLLENYVLLPCVVHGYPTPQVVWERQGKPVAVLPSHQILSNGTLRIDNLRQSSSGPYECVASNVAGTDRKRVHLDVHYGPVISTAPVDTEALVGSTVKFVCDSDANPKAHIVWSRDRNVTNGKVLSNSSVLILNNVQPRDAANYTCTVTNTVWNLWKWISLSVSTSAQLRVIVPPQVQTNTSVVVLKDHSVELRCVATGIPVPSLTWMKDSEEVGFGENLQIKNAGLEDEGRYVCIGENKGGHDSSIVTVDVHFAPSLSASPRDERILVGNGISWRCRAFADPPATITWEKDRVAVIESDRISLARDGDGSELTVLRLHPEDAGQYTCVASNYVGKVSDSADLLVIVPPSITTSVTQAEGFVGSTLLLPCSSQGIPVPSIRWYRGEDPLDEIDPFKYVIHRNGSLQINNLTLSDEDLYTCQASNEGGLETTSISAVIHFAPRIVKGLKDHEVLIGQNVSFSCFVSGNPHPIVRWYRNEIPVSEYSPHLQVNTEGTKLQIDRVQPEDSGLITCEAKNNVTDGARKITLKAHSSAVLVVIVPPQVTSNTSVVVVKKGDLVSLHCRAVGVPAPLINWFKENNEVKHANSWTTHSVGGRIITFSEVSLENVEIAQAGKYVCRAINKGGRSNTTVSLDVQYSPVFVTVPSDQTVIVPFTVTWRCVVAANPPARITWRKDGRQLDDRLNVVLSGDGSELVLTNVNRHDAGEYQCRARNHVGKSAVSATLEVHVRASIVSDVDLVEGLEDSRASLACITRGYPLPQVEWQRDGVSVADRPRYRVLSNGTLRIDNLKRIDSAIYYCVTSNIAGSDRKAVRFDVHFGPYMVTPPLAREVMVNSTVAFVCQANGNPRPTLNWYKDGVAVDDDLVTEDGTVLTVRNAQPKDALNYTCSATNTVRDLGKQIQLSVNASARLRVIVPPQVQTKPSVVVIKGHRTRLDCVVTGIPVPSVRWMKDGEEIVSDGEFGQFEIQSADLVDEGRYDCIAENKGGRATSAVTVDVHFGPSVSVIPQDDRILVGGNITFVCKATSDPLAVIRWQKDGTEMEDGGDIYIARHGRELTLVNLHPEDAGEYTCVASNYVDTVSESAVLLVVVPSSITTIVSRVEGFVGGSVLLPCSSQGIPEPVIRWYRGDTVIKSSSSKYATHVNGTLQINRLTVSDGDVYVCHASNEGGLDTLAITLDIHVAPRIVNGPQNREVLIERSASFSCSVSGNPYPTVRWYHNEIPVTGSTSRLHITENGTVLTVRRVQPEDAGRFTCEAKNTVTDWTRKITLTALSSAVLAVIVPPQITSNTSAVVVQKGDSVSLFCQAVGIPAPAIEWFHGINEVSHTNGSKTESTGGRIITVSEVRMVDVEVALAGKYMCKAINKGGRSNTTISLDVQFSPVFVTVPSSQTVIVPSKVTWRCVVAANPPAAITWIKDGKRLDDRPSVNVYRIDDGSELVLTIVSRRDAGEYVCRARNSVGRSIVSATLEVYVRAEIVSDVKFVEGLIGSWALLPCVTRGYPSPQVDWQREGVSLSGRTRYRILSDGTLRIDNLKQSDSATYHCMASNVAGSDRKDVRLNVHYGPYFVTSPLTREVMVNSIATFTCEVDGNPRPSISWYKDGVAVDDNLVVENGTGTVLTVINAQPKDAVNYTCTATNTVRDLGRSNRLSVSAVARLHVIVPPTVVTESLVIVVRGESATLVCTATGIPVPSIQWIRNNKKISSEGKVTIRSADLEDEGQYICIGKSKGGQANSTVNVDVHFAPKLSVTPRNKRIKVESNVSWRCKAAADPLAYYRWQKDGVDVAESDRFSVARNGSELTIFGLHPNDAGLYTCVAVNYLGSDNASAELLVIVPPKIITSVARAAGLKDSAVVLPCSAEGIPHPAIRWFKDYTTTSLMDSSKHRVLSNGSLTINNLQALDGGVYRCEASNEGGARAVNMTVDVHYGPYFTSVLRDVEILVNKTASFTCAYHGNPVPTITWYKDEVAFSELKSNIEMRQDGSQLVIKAAQPRDAGIYRCVAENTVTDLGRQYVMSEDASASLLVVVPPTTSVKSSRVIALLGGKVSIVCETSGIPPPTVLWLKDNLAVHSNTDRGRTIVSGLLEMSSAELDDIGQYTCVAMNKGGISRVSVAVDVHFSPTLSVPLTNQDVLVSSLVLFQCSFFANPPAIAVWRHNESPVHNSSDVAMYSDKSTYYLRITKVRPQNAGQYMCSAKNYLGNISSSARLFVIVPSKIVSVSNIVYGLLSKSVWLPCVAHGIPTPTIQWTKGGRFLEGSTSSYRLLDNGTLFIKYVSMSHEGQYRCIASNRGGQDNQTVDLDVHIGPSISTPPQDVEVLVGTDATFSCIAAGDPSPSLHWDKNGTILGDDDRFQVSDNGRVLTIRQTTPNDAGVYTCKGENTVLHMVTAIALSAKSSARLTIVVPAQAFATVSAVNVVESHAAVLLCYATGIPHPTFVWYKGNEVITSDNDRFLLFNGSMTIRESTTADTGDYTCIAANKGGSSNATFALDVLFPPRLSSSMSDVRVLVGSTVTWTCSAAANPAAVISWEKDDQHLVLSASVKLAENGTQLTLSDVQPSHSGVYRCVAKNYLTIADASASLFVIVPVHIERGPTVVEGLMNSSVVLPCQVTGVPFPTIRWLRDGISINELPSRKYRLFSNGSLRIFELTKSDSSVYRCIALNEGGEDSVNVSLDVHYGPSLTTSLTDGEVLVGETFTSACFAIGNPLPSIIWSIAGFQVQGNNDRISVSQAGNKLTISQVEITDARTYTCTAQNVVNDQGSRINKTVSSSANLSVIVPAVITSTKVVVRQLAGYTAKLSCIANGIPTPKIEWLKDKSNISNTTRFRVLTSGTLLIHHVSDANGGLYRCVSSNKGGSDFLDIFLDVQFEPVIEDYSADETVIRKSSATFICNVTGNPHPSITWLNKGMPIANTDKHSINNGMLTIADTDAGDTGSYTCLASNTVTNGTKVIDFSVNASAHLTVLVPPNIFTNTEVVTVTKGNRAILPCNATGIPTPHFSWSKNGENAKNSRRRVVQLEGLEVESARIGDSGTYVCTAVNTAGIANITVTLDVHYRPSITLISDSGWHYKNTPLELKCDADGNPSPVFSWLWKGSAITNFTTGFTILNGGRLLTVERVTARYSGKFVCFASNSVGLRSETVRIEMMDRPRIDLVKRVTVKENSAALLACKAKGTPTPDIRWIRDGVYLSQTSFSSDGTLELETASRREGGVYTCEASNRAGKTRKNTTLDVLYPPRILIGPTTINVTVDKRGSAVEPKDVNFTCIAEGNERPDIDWFYRFAPLHPGPLVEFEGLDNPPTATFSQDGTQLTIQNVHALVLHEYSCRVVNSQGRDFRHGKLQRVNAR